MRIHTPRTQGMFVESSFFFFLTIMPCSGPGSQLRMKDVAPVLVEVRRQTINKGTGI